MNQHLCEKMLFCLWCSMKRIPQRYNTNVFNVLASKRTLHFGHGPIYVTDYSIDQSKVMSQSASWKTSYRSLSSDTFADAGYLRERKLYEQIRNSYCRNKRYTARSIKDEMSNDNKEDDEADTFGTLNRETFFETSLSSLDVAEDEDESDWMRVRQRKNTPYWYANQMKKLVRDGKLAEAIDFLETRMLKEDKVQPIEYNYDVLIGACGRAGYTKKAFKLYNRMKERNLHPSNVTYTSLLNACAESPWPLKDGYIRLKKLHQYLLDKEIKLNLITHRAMIKAYGKCGDIATAFHLFHHLLSSGYADVRSFATILTACASNREAGLTYAIEAWRQMVARGLIPDDYCFNLLLRIVRDCGIGDPQIASRILLRPVAVSESHLLAGPKRRGGKGRSRRNMVEGSRRETQRKEMEMKKREETIELFPASIKDVSADEVPTFVQDDEAKASNGDMSEDVSKFDLRDGGKGWGSDVDAKWWQESFKSNDVTPKSLRNETYGANLETNQLTTSSHLPNLLDRHSDLRSVESLADIQTASDRLSLVGNAEGVIKQMTKCGVTPNVKTLSLMLDVVPITTEEEEKLMALVDDHGVAVDVDFYNMIIHRRTKRGQLSLAKEILPVIQEKGLHPNLRTFANLAIECTKMGDGLQLLKDLEGFSLRPNQVLYGALMNAAFRVRNFDYLNRLMQDMKKMKVKPNERIITLLEAAASFGMKAPEGKKPKPHVQKRVNHFRGLYYLWLSEMEAEERSHPWKEYNIKTKTRGEDDLGGEEQSSV